MEMWATMKNRVFFDTAYAIALASPKDHNHVQALTLAREIQTSRIRLVVTRAVMLEIGDALGKQRFRSGVVKLLLSFEKDPYMEIIEITPELYQKTFKLYRERPDKEWGLTDCISFVVMTDLKITEALTSDEHFQQAGFVALMR